MSSNIDTTILEPYVADLTKPIMEQKAERIRAYRTEASRLASMANKRLQRLEGNKLQDSPAYKRVIENGEVRFGVRGKNHNELQAEVSRMLQFLNAETSTIRGSNRVLKQMAENTGIKYSRMSELRDKSKQFFELSSKIEQYLRTVDDMASAIGYQKIWEAVNRYVQDSRVSLGESEFNVEQATKQIGDILREYDKREDFEAGAVTGWFTLDKG